MKKWKKPVITRVKLDPKQAVMQVCQANQGYGAWMDGTICYAGQDTGTTQCSTGARGAGGEATTGSDANAGS